MSKKFLNYKVFSKFGLNKPLPQFLEAKKETLKMYNLFYVVQSASDKSNNVYKVGVSTGLKRISSYVTSHGDPRKLKNKRCAGVDLIYLAGTKMPEYQTSRSESERLAGYMLKQKWSEIKEKFVKKELVAQGFEISRGDEWFYVKTSELSKFKKIVTENKKIKTDEYVVPRAGTRIRKKKVVVSV